MVSFDALRTASRMVGRRTTLRYLALGAGAALVAACGGEEGSSGSSGGQSGGSGGPNPDPKPKPTVTDLVAGKTVQAFLAGSWKISSTSVGGEEFSYAATIGGNTWELDYGPKGKMTGNWFLAGGRIAVQHPEGLNPANQDEEPEESQAGEVPQQVGDSVSLTLPWKPPGHGDFSDGQQLVVAYDKKAGVLRIDHVEKSGSTTKHVCTRVK